MNHPRGVRIVALAALTFAVAGCERGILQETDVRPASLALELSPSAAGGPTQAFDRADRVWLRIGDGARSRFEREIVLTPSGTDVQLPIDVPLRRPTETLDLDIEMRLGGAPLFRGATSLSLRTGRTTRVSVTVDAVVHRLALPDSLSSLGAYGDSVQIAGATVFATGDTIAAVDVEWTSLEPDVIAIEDGIPVAKSDGAARLVGRVGERADTVRVNVFAIVRTIVLDPPQSQLALGESRQYSALLFDARGNPINGRTVEWASSDPDVISIDADGLATGLGVGSARISAASGEATRALQLTALPGPPIVSVPDIVGVTSGGAIVQVNVTPGGSATTVVFEWSSTLHFAASSTTSPQSAGAGSVPVPVSVELEGLVPGGIYYVRAIATNAAGTATGVTTSFTTVPGPPLATTYGAIGIGSDYATLLGAATPNGTTSAWFEWSTSSDLSGAVQTAAKTLQGGTGVIAVAASVIGLPSGTTIYFRIVARNGAGQATGATLSFMTTSGPTPGGPPVASTGAATNVTQTSADLNATVNPNGAATQAWLEWGTDPGLAGATSTTPQSVGAGTSGVAFTEPLTGLAPATTYYFRARASNGNGAATGAIVSFTTASAPIPGGPPAAITQPAGSVTDMTADLNATVDANGAATQAWFEWGTDPALAGASMTAPQSIGSGVGNLPFTQLLGSLLPGTTYYFRVVADNVNGSASGAILSFTTLVVPPPAPPTATTIAATGIGRTKGTLNGTVNPNGSATTAWFEWSTDPTLATFSTTAAQAVGSGAADVSVAEALTGLVWETRYYYRVVASGPGGTVYGAILDFRAIGPPGSD